MESLNNFDIAGAIEAQIIQEKAINLKKGSLVVIKDRPCRVVEVLRTKTGKHGHSRTRFTGIDIFTGKKYEEIVLSSRDVDVPRMIEKEYQLVDIQENGSMALLLEDGSVREDLSIVITEDAIRGMVSNLKEVFDHGKDVLINVIAVMGQEQVVGFKEVDD